MNKNSVYYLIIVAIIIFSILFIILETSKNTLQLNNLNNMYRDLKILEDKISIYYINNGIIPIKDNKIEFKECSINPNDNENFYEIDLEKLENINLYYGKRNNGKNDFYIINEQSHTIYYYEGIRYKNYKIYTKEFKYKNVQLENYQ